MNDYVPGIDPGNEEFPGPFGATTRFCHPEQSEGSCARFPADFGELTPYVYGSSGNWVLRPPAGLPRGPEPKRLRRPPALAGYFYEPEEELACIEHNRRWARGEEESLRFLFAYINLPTTCTLRCKGCFQGMDINRQKAVRWTRSWIVDRLDEILDYLIAHGGHSIAYAGVGELMTDPDALEFIERVRARGLRFVMFTNGQKLATRPDLVRLLDELKVTLILSFRDTEEWRHDEQTGKRGSFARTVTALSNCLAGRFRGENRLAIEMPITKHNRNRTADMLVLSRELGIFPFLEALIVLGQSPADIAADALTFDEMDEIFGQLGAVDRKLGFDTRMEWGQRILGRTACRRPKFTFTVTENRRLIGCPMNRDDLGESLQDARVADVVESVTRRAYRQGEQFYPCSTFVGVREQAISKRLPVEVAGLLNQ
uniref:4Fe-4S single cluster domain-containing protein n=1 Tax=Candidatus Kentrum sp. TC TaxID=2126339 RepID=A0A450YVK5_9GAMM|nr:MAG: 4Fe-4S single cluster domain-containing protein [Candidatus Kentron sp. TC]